MSLRMRRKQRILTRTVLSLVQSLCACDQFSKSFVHFRTCVGMSVDCLAHWFWHVFDIQ